MLRDAYCWAQALDFPSSNMPKSSARDPTRWRRMILPDSSTLCDQASALLAPRLSSVSFPQGLCVRGTRWRLPPRSFSFLWGRTHGLWGWIRLWKRRMRIHHQRGGFTTSLSVVSFPSGTRDVRPPGLQDSRHLATFYSDASDAARTPSVMVDYPYPSSPTHVKILRVVRYSPVNHLYPNVSRLYIAHCVPCPRSRPSRVSEGRPG